MLDVILPLLAAVAVGYLGRALDRHLALAQAWHGYALMMLSIPVAPPPVAFIVPAGLELYAAPPDPTTPRYMSIAEYSRLSAAEARRFRARWNGGGS